MTGYVPDFSEPVDVVTGDLETAADFNNFVNNNLRDLNARLANFQWSGRTFSAGNFYADTQDVSHVWTVDSGDILIDRHIIIEDVLMFWNCVIRDSTTSGGPVSLNSTIPAGRKCNNGPVRGTTVMNLGNREKGAWVMPDIANQNTQLFISCWRWNQAIVASPYAYPNLTNTLTIGWNAMFEVQPT